jgi:zinc transporter ZupT
MMLKPPLQSFDLETLSLARQLSESLTVLLGLAISYIAYRGYRRNQSRPMLFVAAGFALVVGVPAAAGVVLYVVFDAPIPVINSVGQVSELAGMAAILYGLWMPRGE